MDRETAYAKINLALHVRERMADGYHRIETLFVFAADGDGLSVSPAEGLALEIGGPFAAGLSGGADNLVLRAAAALRQAFGVSEGVALRLVKRLPVASGIGGGSADAAAALRLLVRHWRLDADADTLTGIARSLGADVPACLKSEPQRGEGRGEALTPLGAGALSGMPILLANPGVPLATATVFAGWDGVDRGPLARGDPLEAALAGRNDLEPAAICAVPQIGALLELLRVQPGVRLARMSGSGATCFALFDSAGARDAASRAVGDLAPWRLETRLR